jgi:CheY-like chemotaxis protein
VSTTPLIAVQMATILCIDDESSALLVRKRVLESAGYRVASARSGEEGIRLFRSEAFDLVILDYWMPSMNGIVTARELRRINPAVPLIILSGLSQLLDETTGVVDRWILKDEGPEYLLSAIKALLKPASC